MKCENWTTKSQELQILHLHTNPSTYVTIFIVTLFLKTGEQHVEGNTVSIDTVSDQIALHSLRQLLFFWIHL